MLDFDVTQVTFIMAQNRNGRNFAETDQHLQTDLNRTEKISASVLTKSIQIFEKVFRLRVGAFGGKILKELLCAAFFFLIVTMFLFFTYNLFKIFTQYNLKYNAMSRIQKFHLFIYYQTADKSPKTSFCSFKPAKVHEICVCCK